MGASFLCTYLFQVNSGLLYKLDLGGVAGFGCGFLVGITEGDGEGELVALAEAETLDVVLCVGVHETDGTAEAARTDAHGPCGEHHVLAEQTCIELAATFGCGDEDDGGGVAEHVAEALLGGGFLTLLGTQTVEPALGDALDEVLVVDYAHLPWLLVHGAGGVDAAVEDLLHVLVADLGLLVLADGAACEDGVDDGICGVDVEFEVAPLGQISTLGTDAFLLDVLCQFVVVVAEGEGVVEPLIVLSVRTIGVGELQDLESCVVEAERLHDLLETVDGDGCDLHDALHGLDAIAVEGDALDVLGDGGYLVFVGDAVGLWVVVVDVAAFLLNGAEARAIGGDVSTLCGVLCHEGGAEQ